MSIISGTINKSCKIIVLDSNHNKIKKVDYNYGIDPYTKLLLHLDDENIKDYSGNNRLIYRSTPSYRGSVNKFGGYSCFFNGSDDYLYTPYSPDFDFGSGAFTIDFWVYLNALPAGAWYTSYFNHRQGTAMSADEFNIYYLNSGVSYYWGMSLNSGGSLVLSDSVANAMSLGVWHHMAFVRSGNNYYTFKNGSSIRSFSNTATHPAINDIVTIGYNRDSNRFGQTYFNGYINEYRVSKGIARWTSNFTPPTSAYNTQTTSGFQIENITTNSGTVIAVSDDNELSGFYNISYIRDLRDSTGGGYSLYNGYKIHTFLSTGTFYAPVSGTIDILLVGGGGASDVGGGGAGGVLYNTSFSLPAGSYTATVGNGGTGTGNGQNSTFGALLTAYGGGGGKGWWQNGAAGGSGGGGGHGDDHLTYGGSGVAGQGYAGGGNHFSTGRYESGGGGGAGAVGGTSVHLKSGDGGIGRQINISGINTYYGGGGGGGQAIGPGTDSAGGLGGGGAGRVRYSGVAGTANTGGGGGGHGDAGGSVAGGSGIIIVRYRIT